MVSTLQLEDGVEFRVLGGASAHRPVVPVEPSLEDGYIWLMQHVGGSVPGEGRFSPFVRSS